MNLQTFNDQASFQKAVLNEIAKTTNQQKKYIDIALSGGSTPIPIYKELVKAENIDLSKVEFYQVDERYVDKNNENSNYKMISENLISHIQQETKSFHFFDTSLKIDECLKKYEIELKMIPNLEFDLIILGMGEDGHTASLFPNTKALQSKKNLEHVIQDKFSVKDRLTITFRVIMRAKKIILLLKGKEKKSILDKLIKGDLKIKDFPAKKLLQHKELIIYFCKE